MNSCNMHLVDGNTNKCEYCHNYFEIRNPMIPTGNPVISNDVIQQRFVECRTNIARLQASLVGIENEVHTGLEQHINVLNQSAQNYHEVQAAADALGRYTRESMIGVFSLGKSYLNGLKGLLDQGELFVQGANRGDTGQRENVERCEEEKEESEGMEFEFKNLNFAKKG
jgi:hypothetical protein